MPFPLYSRLLALGFGLLLAGCEGSPPEPPAPPAARPDLRQVTDMQGHTLQLPARINRVVGTGGAVDEWILLLGSPEKLVGTSLNIRNNPWFRTIWPGIARVPTPLGTDSVNLEALLGLKPDVVILLSGMGIQARLEKAGLPVVVLERDNPDQLRQAIRLTARIMGPREQQIARRFDQYYAGNIRRVLARTASLPDSERRRVYFAGSQPLVTEGQNSMVDAWIRMAGGINVAARHGIRGIGQTIPAEDLLQWRPEIIITLTPEVRERLLDMDSLKTLPAIRDGRVYVNPRGLYSWGVRSADEALQTLWAAKTIQPERFSDLDLPAEIRAFHREFYHYELSDLEIERMLQALPPPGSGQK